MPLWHNYCPNVIYYQTSYTQKIDFDTTEYRPTLLQDMKFTKKQQLFIDKLMSLIESNNLSIQYEQTFKKKVMLQEFLHKYALRDTCRFDYGLRMSCCQNNDGYMYENIMFSEELFDDEFIDELKSLFNVGNLDEKTCKKVSYVLCLLKKMKISCNFVGVYNNTFDKIYAKYSIVRYKSFSDKSIFGF